MPEEINRVVTDHLSTLLFTTEETANENLKREGIPKEYIHFVGNCMVDTLRKHVKLAIRQEPWKRFGVKPGGYALLTLHRPSNVDDPTIIKPLLAIINKISHRLPVLFPVHPRTRERMNQLGAAVDPSVYLTGPLGYLIFLGLIAKARCVLTDSGGIQEETTALNIPCLTLRGNTERPVTITGGTNRLVGTDPERINQGIEEILAGEWVSGKQPVLWDGQAGMRIVDKIELWAGDELKTPLPLAGKVSGIQMWGAGLKQGNF
jgi:UDP-N-acetylglucosamine 2-epimerase (non-hydrolysing)